LLAITLVRIYEEPAVHYAAVQAQSFRPSAFFYVDLAG
jgi:hypothetical protein